MAVFVPSFPILVEALLRDALVIPRVAIPGAVSVIPPPSGINVVVEAGNGVIVYPSPVIIPGAIPSTLPGAPPPAVPEKEIDIEVRNNVNIVGIGNNDHIRLFGKSYGRRETDADVHVYLRQG